MQNEVPPIVIQLNTSRRKPKNDILQGDGSKKKEKDFCYTLDAQNSTYSAFATLRGRSAAVVYQLGRQTFESVTVKYKSKSEVLPQSLTSLKSKDIHQTIERTKSFGKL